MRKGNVVWPAGYCDGRVRLKAGRLQRGHRNTGLTGAVAVGIASEDTFEGCFSSAKSWKVTKARK